MAFYLTVTAGPDEGRSFRIEPGDYMIGRSPNCVIVLKDESVAWEHAKVREDGGKLFLQNLSSVGTRVRGQRVTDEIRLPANAEIQLTDTTRMIVEQRLAGGGTSSGSQVILLIILLTMLVVGGVGFVLSHQGAAAERPMLPRHWRQAYFQIENQMRDWVRRDAFPPEAAGLFREAWRIDQAGKADPAAYNWEKLESVLMVTPNKFTADRKDTFASSASAGPTRLGIIMGWDQKGASTDFSATTDEGYADALVWFVKKRADQMRAAVEE